MSNIKKKKKVMSALTWASSSFSFISLCLHTSTAFVVDCAPALALLLLRRTLQDRRKAVREEGLTVSHESPTCHGGRAVCFVHYQLTPDFLKHYNLHLHLI